VAVPSAVMHDLRAHDLLHLSRVWRFFRGQHRAFEPCDQADVPADPGLCHRLDLWVEPGRQARALVLLLHVSDASAVASFMFGLSPEEVGASDMADACKELCNVLADRTFLGLRPEQVLDFGQAEALKPEQVQQLLLQARWRQSYRSLNTECPMHVLVLDQPPD